jgi:hypothetical protein
MAVNDKQKLILFDIAAGTVAAIQAKLDAGYVIEFIVSLTPVFNKILVVYAEPPVI